MIRIVLVCSAGMSTSLMVKKMQEAAQASGQEVSIQATASEALSNIADDIDVLMLGPQVAYMRKDYEKTYVPKGIKVDVINTVDYGRMNGEKVLARALELARD
ncbi:PTS system, cellobiose-specific IIB component [Fontibacillus panacisegetis]|uniref:PTS system, cellobiose-specific IIB component n=2 Tax=Fontibacillus TaxID=995014 RepID=A0A1G7FUB8_9BACL|nr:PTS sugar transporter subunit IIB [Fontibacillus panacisegetis]SDE79325.1 PTS system, cellobiose-specific IIB component [Fontibacillus panacisegetis]